MLSRGSRASPRVLSMAGQWRRLWASPDQKHKGAWAAGLERGPFCSLCCQQWQWLQRMRSQGAVPYAFSLEPATATAASPGAPACHSPFSLQADGIFEERRVPTRQAASLDPISLLRRKHISDPNLTPSIKYKVLSEAYHCELAGDNSVKSKWSIRFRKASFTQADSTDQKP